MDLASRFDMKPIRSLVHRFTTAIAFASCALEGSLTSSTAEEPCVTRLAAAWCSIIPVTRTICFVFMTDSLSLSLSLTWLVVFFFGF